MPKSFAPLSLFLAIFIVTSSQGHATSFGCPGKYDGGDGFINLVTFGQRDRQCDEQAARRAADQALEKLQNAKALESAERQNLVTQLKDAYVQKNQAVIENGRLLQLSEALTSLSSTLYSLNVGFEQSQETLRGLQQDADSVKKFFHELDQDFEFLLGNQNNQADPYKNGLVYLWQAAQKRSQGYNESIGAYLSQVIARGAMKTANPAQAYRETLQNLTQRVNFISQSGALADLLGFKKLTIATMDERIRRLDQQILTLDGAPINQNKTAPNGFVRSSVDPLTLGQPNPPSPQMSQVPVAPAPPKMCRTQKPCN